MSSTRVLVIGAGHWGSTVAQRINQPDIDLTVCGVVDLSHGAAEKLAHALQVPWYGAHDLDAAVADTGAQWAILATPPLWRADYVKDLTELGIERVRVEKPLALTVSECDEILQYDIDVSVGHTTLYDELWSWVDSSVTNPIRWHSIRWTTTPPRHDVDAWWDLASHDIAQALMVGVPMSCVTVDARHSMPTPVRRTIIQMPDKVCVVDEQTRTATIGSVTYSYTNGTDPLGAELQKWASGGGIPGAFGRRVVGELQAKGANTE